MNARLMVAAAVVAWGVGGARAVELKGTPAATKSAKGVTITFAASEATDVEVAVLDSAGKVVRHLAAGALGPNAPAPLKAGALQQSIEWDLRDDAAKPAAGGPFTARIRLGAAAAVERIVGWNPNTLIHPIVGLTVGPGGEVYVMTSEYSRGRSELIALDREGKYLRTVMPYPADTPAKRAASAGQIVVDGERLPIVFNAHGHNLMPLTSGMKKQTMVFTPKGHLLMASAVGTICNHGPPRHLLAVHPQGGGPEGVGFVGPQILAPRGFMGGAGEGGSRASDHLAVSPDGKWIYLTTAIEGWAFRKLAQHAVFRLKWSDEKMGEPFLGAKEPGDDDAHFNDPQGLATDAKGNLYVCDRGNDRVMVFDAGGKLLGKFAVDDPWQIAVHPKGGQIYVACRGLIKRGKRLREAADSSIRKLSAWGAGEPKELARLDVKTVELMALDPHASTPRLWVALHTAWRRSNKLVTVTDTGGKLEMGESVVTADGLGHPMYVAADPDRGRLYVTQRGAIRRIDLASGKMSGFPKARVVNATEPAVDREGNVYIVTGWSLGMQRFDPKGDPLPFDALGTHKMGPIMGRYPNGKKEYRCYASGVTLGSRGHAVAANGDIYMLKMRGNGHGGTLGQLDVYGPDGKLKSEAVVARTVGGSSGLGIDPAGNIYVGSNLKAATGSPMPFGFAGKVPETGWRYWRAKRERPWWYTYYNPYLFHWGAIFKFGPGGGQYFGAHSKSMLKEHPEVAVEAPAGAMELRNGYLNRKIHVAGALWRYDGFGPLPDGTAGWGDPSCCCWTSRFAVDGYGRVFAPNVFRFSVEMLDTNGNHIMRIGRYGNADSAGPASKVSAPAIAFAWPAFTAAAGGKLYVCDPLNRRISVIRFTHAAEATCKLN